MCSYVVAAGDKLLRDRAPAASSIGFSVHGHLLRCPLLRYARPFCFRDTISPFTFYVHCTNINSSPDSYIVVNIPDICHGRTDDVRVKFFWPV